MKYFRMLEDADIGTTTKTWLEQKGPKSLNYINKRNEINRINGENQKIK